MKRILRKSLLIVLLVVLSFNIMACKTVNNLSVSSANNITITEKIETSGFELITSDTKLDNELFYDTSKTLTKNIVILNKILKKKYGKGLAISTVKEYENTDPSDWTLVLKKNRVGIDTSTWKFDCDSNSDDSKYMDAILSTFTFFCGEKMGKSLWLLTGDLLDGGADETLYGFVHNGSKAVYKNGNVAVYEPGSSKGPLYIWLTPSKY